MPQLQSMAARMFCVGFTGVSVPAAMHDLIRRGVGGAILFKRNFESAAQLAGLCAELKSIAARPFLTSMDHEGGRVVRLGPPFTPIPAMREIGRVNDPQRAREIGRLMARELRAVHIDMNFAPVLDVDTNPLNPVIGDRSFGPSSSQVAQLGAALIDGLQSLGVAACGKHFPGHGDTLQDSHLDLPRLTHSRPRLLEIELPPFDAAARADVAAIMTAHVLFEAIDRHLPATMSRDVLTGLLRNDLHFNGVIISDDLEMKAIANHYPIERVIISAVNAGVDLLMICHTPALQHQAIDLLIRAVERGDVALETLLAANERLDRLFQQFVKPPVDPHDFTPIGCEAHRQLIERFNQTTGAPDPTCYKL